MLRLFKKAVTSPAGFSLVELSIVMVIVSTIAVFGLEGAATFLSRTAYETTALRIQAIDEAILKFRQINGRLPCPADRTVAITDGVTNDGYGKEYCNAALVIATTALWQGAVPVRDLNLPLSYAIDGYGNKFNYIVSSGLTVAATFATTTDGIIVRSGKLEDPCATVCEDMGTAAYFLFSNGYDRRGGISSRGNVNANCIATTASDMKVDAQNCIYLGSTVALGVPTIDANVFYDSRYNRGLVEANYFDDIVLWHARSGL